MRSGLGSAEKLAAFATFIRDSVPDPGGRLTRAAATHDDAHQQLARAVALDRFELTARRAKNRLRKLKGLMRVLDKTDHVCERDVPCRAERHRLIDPVLAELERLAKHTHHARRERKAIPARKETPMTDYNPGGVVEGPREEPAAAPATLEATLADFPPVLRPYLAHFEMKFAGPPLNQVLTHEAYRLANVMLDLPAAERSPALARLLFRLATRAGR